MHVPPRQIEENLRKVKERIAAVACGVGRDPESIRLVAVTKSVGIEEAEILYELGVREFGENRLQEAQQKIKAMKQSVTWHMIGAVQRRKARDVAALFHCVDSVDRTELAAALNEHCEKLKRTLPILVEVNVSGEESKHGFAPEQLPNALELISRFEYLRNDGLMTMAPLVKDPEETRPLFARLRELRDRFGLKELSMGMSNDFEVAIEEGATQVRIGTALFQ